MNWPDEPATEQQLAYLEHFGYVADHPLKRAEAAELIKQFREHPKGGTHEGSPETVQPPGSSAYHLGMVSEKPPQVSASVSVAPQKGARFDPDRRQEFWLDTCREMIEMHAGTAQVFELYQKHGCRFVAPTAAQVEEVLRALDSAMVDWEQVHPELFYQTLELNFPELVKHHV